jgi:cytochrome c peroxidase
MGAPMSAWRRLGWLALVLVMPIGCGGDAPGDRLDQVALSPEAALGERMFHDPSLSASGRLACAGCHVATFGHAQASPFATPFGGADMRQPGRRSAPSIRYLAADTRFGFDAQGRPVGGLFWDGRADTLAEQARHPLLDAREMALADPAELAVRLAQAPYADEFRRVYGADILARPDDALARVTHALASYQLEDAAFRPFSSKYDAVLRGQATLDEAEARGLALFNDPNRANCAACHPSAKQADGSHPLFTNFGYAALGVPRNDELPDNADPAYHDLGLCAREGGDLAMRTDLCGAFKVPTLRNVALKRSLFHNGRFRDLREALAFYARRDTHPQDFYPRNADGSIDKFNDLPEALRSNVETRIAPYGRRPGDAPALNDGEIENLIAFLRTLSDGWPG